MAGAIKPTQYIITCDWPNGDCSAVLVMTTESVANGWLTLCPKHRTITTRAALKALQSSENVHAISEPIREPISRPGDNAQ
jgi:hypothetical protein